jgi:lysophospholipid acyltransferase
MSALWHGFYPGYFLCFLTCGLINETARVMRRHVRPLFIPNEKADKTLLAQFYHFGSWFITLSSLNYCAVPFVALSFDESIGYWIYWRFAPHFLALALYLLVPIIFKSPSRPAKKE